MPYVREFLKLQTFKGFIDKADRNSVEDFCHPSGAVCKGADYTRHIYYPHVFSGFPMALWFQVQIFQLRMYV